MHFLIAADRSIVVLTEVAGAGSVHLAARAIQHIDALIRSDAWLAVLIARNKDLGAAQTPHYPWHRRTLSTDEPLGKV